MIVTLYVLVHDHQDMAHIVCIQQLEMFVEKIMSMHFLYSSHLYSMLAVSKSFFAALAWFFCMYLSSK